MIRVRKKTFDFLINIFDAATITVYVRKMMVVNFYEVSNYLFDSKRWRSCLIFQPGKL